MSKSINPFNKIKIMQEDDDVEDLTTIPARLRRGFSKTGNNIELVGLARDFMLKDISLNSEEEFFAEKTEFTFTLPDLTKYPENFKAFLFKELVESSMLVSLEQEGHLNWWTDIGVCERLLPMVTCGDGNCLLHAASLSMWGFHDRVLALRRALNTVMLRSRHLDAFRRRWRHQQSLFLRSCELVLDENEWNKEWDLLVEVTSLEPRNAPRNNNTHGFGGKKQFGGGSQAANQTSTAIPSDAIYESLEEFHVFILCHIIKRPIIVMANPFLKNSQGENFSPVPFRGIYLPLERAPEDCCTSPLLLAYNLGHFCALAAMQSDSSSANTTLNIPLVDCDMNLLPIHFLVDPSLRHGNEFRDPSQEEKLFILKKYLEANLIGERDDLLIDLGNGSMTSGSNPSNKTGPIHGTRAEVLSGFDPFKRRRSSLQSTKYVRPFSKSFDAQGVNDKKILCARLNVKKTPFANELVKNYLKEAQLRFEGMTRQKVGQLEEIRRRSKEGIKLRHIGQPSSHSGKLLNIFRSNNEKLDHANKSLALGTFPPKSLYPEQEIQNLMPTGNLIPSATNSNFAYRRSVPIGFLDQNPSDVQPLGSAAKKEPSGAVKTIQKLLGQNKVKTEKSTFYTTKPSTTVFEGKSKFYTPLQETEVKNMESSSNNSSKDVRPNSSSAFKLPQIFQRIPSPASSSALSLQADESNFSTFPSRSSTLRSASSSKTEESTSSLPKIKSKNKINDQDWTKSYGFNASTSEPNIFDGELQNDRTAISSNAGGSSVFVGTNLNHSAGKTSSSSVLPCRSDGCMFFGSKEKSGYCSVCFAERGFEGQMPKDSNINNNRQSHQGYPLCQTKL